MALSRRLGVAGGGVGEVAVGGGGGGQRRTTAGGRLGEDRVHGGRRQRQVVVPVAQRQAAPAPNHGELGASGDGGDPIGQQRSQDPAVQLGVGDVPVDVEDRGEGAPPAVLEDIAPPWVGRRVGGHMVGHDVEEQRHALAAQRGD